MKSNFLSRLIVHCILCFISCGIFALADNNVVLGEEPRIHGVTLPPVACTYTLDFSWPIASSSVLNTSKAESVLFVSYLVTSDLVRVEVLWAEPCWTATIFPGYAPGTVIVADINGVSIHNAYNGFGRSVKLPLAGAPRLSARVKPWEIEGLGYWWQTELSSRANRIVNGQSSSIGAQWLRSNVASGDMPDLGVDRRGRGSYRVAAGSSKLESQLVKLPEERTAIDTAELRKSKDLPNFPDQIFVRRRLEGRSITVDWSELANDGQGVVLPSLIEVKAPADGLSMLPAPRQQIDREYGLDGRLLSQRVLETNVSESRYSSLPSGVLRSARFVTLDSIPDLSGASRPSPAFWAEWIDSERAWYGGVRSKYWGGKRNLSEAELRSVRDSYSGYVKSSELRHGTAFRLRELYAGVITALIVKDAELFKELLARYVMIVRGLGTSRFSDVCEASLIDLCRQWNREEFAGIAAEGFK